MGGGEGVLWLAQARQLEFASSVGTTNWVRVSTNSKSNRTNKLIWNL